MTQNSTFIFAQHGFEWKHLLNSAHSLEKDRNDRNDRNDRENRKIYTPKLQQIMIISAVVYHQIIYDKRNV